MPKRLDWGKGGEALVLHTIYTLVKLEIILYQRYKTGIFYQSSSINKHQSKPSKLALSFQLCSSSFSVQAILPIFRYSTFLEFQ